MGRKPVVEVENHPGEEAGFTDPQQETQHVEHGARFDMEKTRQRYGEGYGHGDHGPGQHDPRNPEACTVAMQQQVARHFKEEVAPEEHTGAQGIHRIAELQLVEHVELGKADVDPVQVGGHVTQEQDGKDAPDDLAVGSVFKVELAGLRLRR
ncbi:hypothetical protein D3C76_1410780 [compost metagenome]